MDYSYKKVAAPPLQHFGLSRFPSTSTHGVRPRLPSRRRMADIAASCAGHSACPPCSGVPHHFSLTSARRISCTCCARRPQPICKLHVHTLQVENWVASTHWATDGIFSEPVSGCVLPQRRRACPLLSRSHLTFSLLFITVASGHCVGKSMKALS